jgi:hypothetical protein
VELNVPGGGQRQRFRNVGAIQVQPDLSIDATEIDSERSLERIVCTCAVTSKFAPRWDGEGRELPQRNA